MIIPQIESVYRSAKDGLAPSGFWRGGKMYIDVNAGMNGEGLILFTAAHEIVHMIREGSPEDFSALADFLVENYAKKGVDVNKLVLMEMTRSTNPNYDQAFEEVIARSCESFLRDIHLSDKAEQLYKTDKGLATKIKNILNRILNAVKKWYGVAKPQSVEANYVSEMKDALSEAYDKYIAGIRAASENLRNMEKSTEGAPKNMLRDIPSAFDQNIKSVAIMDPVVSLTGNEFAKSNVDLITQVTDYFNSVGGVAHSQYGDVRLTRSGVKASIGHGIGRNKAIAFMAVQNVLQDGLMIDYQKNWKQRGYNTAVIAAPITIGQNDYYMAAIVIEQSGTNDYYLHEVLLKEKENATAFKTGTAKSGTPSAETSSIYSILRDLQNINTSSQNNQSVSDADYLSAVKRGDMKTAQRMVDEAAKAAGYDRHLYHGAKAGGGFTVFKGWQYFTASKAYAERYTQRETGKGLYDVYVKSDRLFDTRKADDRAIFGEYKNEYGMGELQENGLPDWTDGYDLSDTK